MLARRVCRSLIAVALCVALTPAPVFAQGVSSTAPSRSAVSLPRLSAPTENHGSAEPSASAGVIYRVIQNSTPDQVAARHGLGKPRQIDSRAPQVASLGVPKGASTAQVLARLQADPAVVYASPNYVRRFTVYNEDPSDTYFRDTSAFQVWDPSTGSYVNLPYDFMRSWWLRREGLNITPVWGALAGTISSYGPRSGSSAFKVGVIDSGFYLTHEDRGDNIVGAKDEFSTYSSATGIFTTDDDVTPPDPSAPANSVIAASHGTCVAGEIAAATDNSLGVAATGWDAQVRVYKVLGIWEEGDGTASYPPYSAVMLDGAIINAIYDATDDGCKIINMSFGGYSDSSALQDAIDYAHSQGVIVVAAAGNDNTDAAFYPAADNNVLSVGSMGLSGTQASPVRRRSSFSNYGPTLDIMGPGEYVWGLVQPGYDNDGAGAIYYPGYYWWQGTSMASPAVAGSIAALWRFQPSLSADEMVSYIENTASGGGIRSDNLGYGYADANAVYQRMKSDYPALPVPSVTGLPASGSLVNQTAFTASWPLQPGYDVGYAATLDGSSVPVSAAEAASSTFAGLSDGNHTVAVRSTSPRNWYDPSGFETSFTVDTVVPVFSTPTYDATSRLLSWSATDSNGLASQAVAVTNIETGVTATTTVGPAIRDFDLGALPQGDYRATVSGTDAAGNSGQSAVGSFFKVTGAAPVTTISALPSGWANRDVVFSLTASDVDSPFGLSTYYGLNAPAVTSYTMPVAVSAEGVTIISYFSVDASSNAEPTKSATVQIDKTAPSTSDDHAAAYTGSAMVHLTPSDALSGVAGTTWTLDGTLGSGTTVRTTSLGSHTLLYNSTDEAGNTESPHVVTFTVIPTPQPVSVYRFYDKKNGSHFYTASESEKNMVLAQFSMTYSLDGLAYTINAASPANSLPLYRFYNKKNGSHFYTASESEKNIVLATLPATYSLDGPAFYLAP